MDWEFGFSRLYIGRINSKVLLYSTGNYIQCPVISQNGKEYEKRHPQPSARLPRVRNREAREGAGRAGARGCDAMVQARAILLHMFRTRDRWKGGEEPEDGEGRKGASVFYPQCDTSPHIGTPLCRHLAGL